MSDNRKGSARNRRPPVLSAPLPYAPASDARRRWLIQAGALVSSTALPLWIPGVSAQSQSTLNALPRVALVIGNTKYVEAPLKNPANDAKAIAESLRQLRFNVNLRLDAGRAEMIEAIRSFGAQLGKQKAVGLFYYAGHGAQLAWKNYLIPVDAIIEKIDDMQEKTVELNSLLAGIVKAQNPMNVIILDACRDNPFGTKVHSQQKGLSQFDAPPSSLLAYATSPGNTAADGAGANGLYTENLLRELKTPEAKIEDVFKRVRLNVRRKSEGQQIPWESTSLEEDFYFLPPQHIRQLSEAEVEKQFDEELAIWEKIQNSANSAPFENYLRRYPSGRFAELAQLRLDEVLARQGEKRIQVASYTGNPFTQGFVRADTDFKLGDAYSFRELDLETKTEKRSFEDKVTEIREGEVIFQTGLILDRLGNTIRLPDGRRFTPRQDQPLEYAIGKRWTTRFSVTQQSGLRSDIEFEFRIARREKISVPAGTFECFVIDGEGTGTSERGAKVESRLTRWMAPDKVRRPIVTETYRKVRIERRGPAGQSGFEGPGGFSGKGPGGFPGKGPGGFGGPGGFAGKGPGGPIERVLNSERIELVAFKQN